MADWRMTGTYFKSCNCDPGCPCDFMSAPTHHKCEGVLGMKVDEGHFGDVSLDGVKWAVAYHWPGPLHEGNGTVKPYFDPATTQEQLGALGQILTGQAGGTWFEVLASIITEVKPPAIAPIDFEVTDKTGKIMIGDMIENRFAPLKNPVTGQDVAIQVRIPGGMEYSDQGEAEIVRSELMRSTDEIGFDYAGCHTSLVERQTFGSHR
ncbi:MAG TPA: DUF1326 domain-containing protein [Pyrinomonadaceae bacterium]|jgi:hypothetical protein